MRRFFALAIMAVVSMQAQAQNLYGDMETWKNYSAGFPPSTLESVKGWRCADSLIFTYGPFLFPGGQFTKQLAKTTDAHGGNYAAKVMTIQQDSFGKIPGILTNATINVDVSTQSYSLSGGTPVSGRVNYVNAWVKYIPKGGDSANIVASAILAGGASNGDDSVLGKTMINLAATPAYTLVSLPILYSDPNAVPDAVQVVFTSSGYQATDSSTLYIDDVSYTLFPEAVGNVALNNVRVYPNPASTSLFVRGPENASLTIQIMNTVGKVVIAKSFAGSVTVDVATLSAGVYFYAITDNGGKMLLRSKLTIER